MLPPPILVNDAPMKNSAQRLRTARQHAGLTALELARHIGVNEMRVYAIERGRYRVREAEARAIGRVLGIDPARLIGGAR